MNKNILRITTILCGLATLIPGVILASKSKTGSKGTYTVTNESTSGYKAAYSEKTSANGGSSFRQVEDANGEINIEMYDTTANGRTISTNNWKDNSTEFSQVNVGVYGSKGSVEVGGTKDEDGKSAGISVDTKKHSVSKAVDDDDGQVSAGKEISGPKGSITKTESDGSTSTTITKDNNNNRRSSKSIEKTTNSDGQTTISVSRNYDEE